MRVGVVIDQYRPRKGGLEIWLERFAAHLAEVGHEICLVSADRDAPPAPFRDCRVAVSGWSRARRDRRFAEAARERCGEEGFDSVLGLRHSLACDVFMPHGGSVAASFEARARARRFPRPTPPRVRGFLALERELLEGEHRPRTVVAVSELVKRDLAARYPGIANRIRVVTNGVDLERFRPVDRGAARGELGLGPGAAVLFLAANPRLKGWRFACDVFRRLRDGGAAETLLIAGRPPGRLPEGARYLGRLDDPTAVLGSVDLLLQPTLYDPFPLSTLESLACGTPVVTTERNGALDHVGRDGPVRAVPEPEDVFELSRLAATLLAAAPREEARRVAERFPEAESLAAVGELL